MDLAAFRRKLDGIGEQIASDLSQAVWIGVDWPDWVFELCPQVDTLRLGNKLDAFNGLLNHLFEVSLPALQMDFAGRDPRCVQQVVQQLNLRLGAAFDD